MILMQHQRRNKNITIKFPLYTLGTFQQHISYYNIFYHPFTHVCLQRSCLKVTFLIKSCLKNKISFFSEKGRQFSNKSNVLTKKYKIASNLGKSEQKLHRRIMVVKFCNLTQRIIPYIHEAKCSDVWRVCVSDQSHQLFASQLESKQFVQKTESSRHNTTSPNSTHLKRIKT